MARQAGRTVLLQCISVHDPHGLEQAPLDTLINQVAGAVRGDFSTPVGMGFDLVIADADDEDLAAWERAVWLRTRFPNLPLVILAHGAPGSTHLERLQRYHLVRKPFAIDELLSVCAVALSNPTA